MDLRELLKEGRIVEIKYNYESIGMGVVSCDGAIITAFGKHYIGWYDDYLYRFDKNGVLDDRIEKIYENKEDGLKCIWDRKRDIDWSKVEPDTKVQVSEDGVNWYNRHFSHYDKKKDLKYVVMSGKSIFGLGDEFNKDEDCIKWEYVRLFEQE